MHWTIIEKINENKDEDRIRRTYPYHCQRACIQYFTRMAQAAADKGLKVLGITEHSPGVPGTCHPIYFRNLHVVPRRMYGVELLLGAEINILDGKGNLDLDEDYMKMLDIRIAGIHSLCYEYGTIEENTHGMVQVISNPFYSYYQSPRRRYGGVTF